MFPDNQDNLIYQQSYWGGPPMTGDSTRFIGFIEPPPSLYEPMSTHAKVAPDNPSEQSSQDDAERDKRVRKSRREMISLEFSCKGANRAILGPADLAFVERQRSSQALASYDQDQDLLRKVAINEGISCPGTLQVIDRYLRQDELTAQLYQAACSGTPEDKAKLPPSLQRHVDRMGWDHFRRHVLRQGTPEVIEEFTRAKCFDLVGRETDGEVVIQWRKEEERPTWSLQNHTEDVHEWTAHCIHSLPNCQQHGSAEFGVHLESVL